MKTLSKLSELLTLLTTPKHLNSLMRGDSARDRKDWATAIQEYTRYLEAVPSNAAIHIQLGHCLKENGDYKGAGVSYFNAYALTPDDDDLALQIGHLEKLKGDKLNALKWYERSLALNTHNNNALIEIEFLQKEAQEEKTESDHQALEIDTSDVGNKIISRRILPNTSETIKQKQRLLSEKIENTIKVLEDVHYNQ